MTKIKLFQSVAPIWRSLLSVGLVCAVVPSTAADTNYDAIYGGLASTDTKSGQHITMVRDSFGRQVRQFNNGATRLQYDAHGRRRVKQNGSGDGLIYQYAGNGLSPLYIRDISAKTTDLYVPGLTEVDESSDGLTRSSYTPLLDFSGSTRALLDTQQSLVERYEYDTIGKVSESTDCATSDDLCDSDIAYPFLYQGHEYDYETGLHNFVARMYSDDIGRFYHTDTAGQAIGYAALGNNWPNNIDADGNVYFENAQAFVAYVRMIQRYIAAKPYTEEANYLRPPIAHKYGAVEALLRNTDTKTIERNLNRIQTEYADVKPGPGTATLFRHARPKYKNPEVLDGMIHTSIKVQLGDRSIHSNMREDHRTLRTGEKIGRAKKHLETRERLEKYDLYNKTTKYRPPATIIESWEKPIVSYKFPRSPNKSYVDLAEFHGYKLKDGLTAILFAELAEDGSLGHYSFEYSNCALYCLHVLNMGEHPLSDVYYKIWRFTDRGGFQITRWIDNYNFLASQNGHHNFFDTIQIRYSEQARETWRKIFSNDKKFLSGGFRMFGYSSGVKPNETGEIPWSRVHPLGQGDPDLVAPYKDPSDIELQPRSKL